MYLKQPRQNGFELFKEVCHYRKVQSHLLTRFLRSSHPSPPAPMTRILHVSNKNCRDWFNGGKKEKKRVEFKPSHIWTVTNIMYSFIVTSVLGSKSGWVKGPGLSKNFFTWFQRPSQSQPLSLCPLSTAILDARHTKSKKRKDWTSTIVHIIACQIFQVELL